MNTPPAGKRKTEVFGMLLPGGAIKYATEHDRDLMRGMPAGTPIVMRPMGHPRNLKYHRKFWKLLELGLTYWVPNWRFISAPEEWVAHEVAKAVGEAARDPTLYENVTKAIAESVLQRLIKQRRKRFTGKGVKREAIYFNHVMVKAGFYDLKPNPEGGTLKQRWSIAFANMDQSTFAQIYKGVAKVIWQETLNQHFASSREMEQAVNRLLEY